MARRAFLVGVLVMVALAVPVPASAGGGGCAELTEGTGATVEILYSCITPTILRVDPGDEVTFVNRDGYRHVIAGAGYYWASDGYMGPNEAFTATFRKDGVYPYQCYLHPGMAGAVIVGTGTGLGPASKGGVLIAPYEGPEPLPKVVYLEREPETVVRRVEASSAGAWTGGIAVGVAAGALIVLGGVLLVRRRRSAAER
jgi:plastocyanin